MISERQAFCGAFAAVLVVSALGVGPVGGAVGGGESVAQTSVQSTPEPSWQAETHYGLVRMAERYNAAVDDGADPRLADERVQFRVTDSDGTSATFRFAIGGDGRIGSIAAAETDAQWSDATLLLATSPGTIDYLAAAENPVAAFETVFVRLGDVRGPGVARAADGGFEYTDDWIGSRFTVRVALPDSDGGDEAGGDGGRSQGDAVYLLDLRGGGAAYSVLPTSDLDGDGRPDVASIAGPGDAVDQDDDGDGLSTWQLYRVPLPAGGDADAAARGIEKHQIKRGMVIANSAVSDGGTCDDADPLEWPGDTWYQPRCDGGVDVDPLDDDADGDGVLYISVEEEGAPRTLRKDAEESTARRSDNGSKPGRTTYATITFERVSAPDADGSATGDGDDPATVFDVSLADGHPSGAPVVYEASVGGSAGDATLFVDGQRTRRIEPVTARGVGVVGRIKWGVVSFLRGIGLF